MIILTACTLACLVYSVANGQVLTASYDFNTPAAKTKTYFNGDQREVSSGLAFGFGLHNNSVFAPNPPIRLGIEVGFQKLTVGTPGAPATNTRYSKFRVMGSVDQRVIGISNLNLSIGMAGGFSFVNDSQVCNEPLCDLPKSGLLVTPRIKVSMLMSSKVAVFFDTRWDLYLNDDRSTYPYKSGIVFAVGVSLIRMKTIETQTR